MNKKTTKKVSKKLLKLDLGCGINKKDGFIGVDIRKFKGVDVVADLTKKWPWAAGSVGEIWCSHTVEHFKAEERIHVVNEMHRVLTKGGKATIITPHWCSSRAYGDLTHQWPPVSEFWYFYLNAEWRKVNAPHNDGYECDFEATWGYGLHQSLNNRTNEFQQFAVSHYKEVCTDLAATLVKK